MPPPLFRGVLIFEMCSWITLSVSFMTGLSCASPGKTADETTLFGTAETGSTTVGKLSSLAYAWIADCGVFSGDGDGGPASSTCGALICLSTCVVFFASSTGTEFLVSSTTGAGAASKGAGTGVSAVGVVCSGAGTGLGVAATACVTTGGPCGAILV